MPWTDHKPAVHGLAAHERTRRRRCALVTRPGTGPPAVETHRTGTLALTLERIVGFALGGLARCRDSAIATAEEPTSPRGLPAATEAVPGGVGPVVVGDRPPVGDLSPYRMALGRGQDPAHPPAPEGAGGACRQLDRYTIPTKCTICATPLVRQSEILAVNQFVYCSLKVDQEVLVNRCLSTNERCHPGTRSAPVRSSCQLQLRCRTALSPW